MPTTTANGPSTPPKALGSGRLIPIKPFIFLRRSPTKSNKVGAGPDGTFFRNSPDPDNGFAWLPMVPGQILMGVPGPIVRRPVRDSFELEPSPVEFGACDFFTFPDAFTEP